MKKEQLRKLRALYATRAMMYKASQDIPYVKTMYGSWKETVYKYGIYMRVQILDGYMKIALFLAGSMKQGAKKPAYEIFIDRNTGEFITWDCVAEKWRDAMIDNLEFPSYVHYSGKYINSGGFQSIKDYLGVSKGGWAGIAEYQRNIRAEELKRKHRRETDPWDEDMEQIQELPKDFRKWIDRTGIKENYIFYEYKRNVKEGWCTYCRAWVPVKNPKHNAAGTCKKCRKQILYKSIGGAGRFNTNVATAYVLQRCGDGFVNREFRVYRHYQSDMLGVPVEGKSKEPELVINEVERDIYTDAGIYPTVYNWTEYKDRSVRWCRNPRRCYAESYYAGIYNGMVYKRNLSAVQEHLAKTGLLEFIKGTEMCDPFGYLKVLHYKKYIEKMSKVGLFQLAKEEIKRSTWFSEKSEYQDSNELTKMLHIDSFRLKRLTKLNGGRSMLKWFQHEKVNNKQYPDECIKYFSDRSVEPKELSFILDRMTVVKACNYLKKQEKYYPGKSLSVIISNWEDYLKMAKRLKMDVTKELFYKPKNINEAHARVIELMEENGLSIKAGEIADKYPKVEEILAELKEKYSYQDKKFTIIIPERIEDMLNESNALSLCMDRDDRYYERISIRETYIAFLRKQSEPEQPWYVIEFEPNGTLRQESTVGDNKNKDFDEAIPFIKKWQRELSKRITQKDRELAKKSVELRLKEFEQLRKDKNQIRRGPLQGKLLIDVLEQRLMEVEENVG